MIVCMAAMILAAIAAATFHAPYDYGRDPRAAAIRAFADDDPRYLAVRGEPVNVTGEPVDRALDVRDLPPASAEQRVIQRDYIDRYNAVMRTIVSQARGRSTLRRRPLPRALFAVELLLAIVPFTLMLYVRYRLGAYRLGSQSWTTDFWSPVRYLTTSSYSAAGAPLLGVLWALHVVTVPWILFVVLVLFRGWGPLQ